MPFENFQWSEGRLELRDGDPKPELREDDARNFTLLKSFCYRVALGDPEHETVYVVPGADAGLDPQTRIRETTEEPPHRAVVPPSLGGKTDLASVPPFLWWLIASYGNHTRAARRHAIGARPSAGTVVRTAGRGKGLDSALLVWTAVPGARYYNVQLWRRGKILSACVALGDAVALARGLHPQRSSLPAQPGPV